jgi:septation ring formation regulator EzrA
VYGPLIALFDQETEALADKVSAKQRDLRQRVDARRARNYDEEIRQLEANVGQLTKELAAMPSYSYSYATDEGSQHLSALESQILNMRQQAEEIGQFDVQLREALAEFTKAVATGEQFNCEKVPGDAQNAEANG